MTHGETLAANAYNDSTHTDLNGQVIPGIGTGNAPTGGNVACAWVVGNIVNATYGTEIVNPNSLSVEALGQDLDNHPELFQAIPVDSNYTPQLGDVIDSYGYNGTGHVGVVIDTAGDIVSNSSRGTNSTVEQNYNVGTWEAGFDPGPSGHTTVYRPKN